MFTPDRNRRAALVLATALAAPLGAAATLKLGPCRLPGVEHPARCGVLARPLDPAQPGGRQIELHVAVLPALARRPHADPVFFLAGGPGQSAIELAGAAQRMLPRIGQRRDWILVEQRGSGRSAALRCPEVDNPLRPLGAAANPEQAVRDMARCRAALQALPHGDLRQYTTAIAAADLDAVRQALGLRQINLMAVSYGTRLALEYMRQQPAAVRRAVLDGVAPPDQVLPATFADDAQSTFDALLAWCSADADCARRHPRLGERWTRLLSTLPRKVSVPHPVSGQDEALLLTPGMATALLRPALYTPATSAALPHALEQAIDGHWAALVGLSSVLSGAGRRGAIAQGLHFSVVCSEDVPQTQAHSPGAAPQGGPRVDPGLGELYRRVCADWPRGKVDAAFRSLGPAAAPVLLLSGGLDPVTPPRHAARAAAALGARARHWVVPQAGHGVAGLPCLREPLARFIEAADEASALAVDGSCAARLPRPPLFVAPGPGADR